MESWTSWIYNIKLIVGNHFNCFHFEIINNIEVADLLESLVTARPFLFLLLIIDNSDYDLKHFQGFVCFHCQKIILFQNIPDILKYPERVFSKNVCRFNFTSPSWDIFCGRSRYLDIRWFFNRLFWCFSCYNMFVYKKTCFCFVIIETMFVLKLQVYMTFGSYTMFLLLCINLFTFLIPMELHMSEVDKV